MVRGAAKLVPWCRLLGRRLDSRIRGGGGSSSTSVSINAANGLVVDGQACRCLSSSAGSLAGLFDGDGTGGRPGEIGTGNTGSFSTVPDVTEVGSKSSDNEVSFDSLPRRDEAPAGDDGLDFLKPPFSGTKGPDNFLFGTGCIDVGSNSSSVSKEVSFTVEDKVSIDVGSNSSSVSKEVSFTVEDKENAGRGPYFPASQFPDAPPLPRLRNDRYFRSRNDSTVANMLKLVEAASSQEEVGKVLADLVPDLNMTGRWPWLPLFDALQRGPKPYLALEVFIWKQNKFEGGDPKEYAKMISTAGKLNHLDVAEKLFKDMEAKGVKRSPMSCNALISAYSKNDHASKALEVFQQMQESDDCKPTLVTYNTLISMYSKLSVPDMERTFDLCKSSGFYPDRVTFNSMVWGYMRGREFLKMEEMYEELKRSGCKPDPITFSGLIIGFCKANQVEKMELAFSHMQEEGFPISTMIAEILIEFYAANRKFEKMERIMKITVNTPGASCSSRIFGYAIQAYAETGRIQEMEETMEKMFAAKRLFTSTKTLESVITAYGTCANFEALDVLLQRIKSMGWTYQHSTYHTLLYEYGKGVWLEKMENIFNEMLDATDVIPTEETYTIVADSYRAAGDEEGVKRTIDRMSAAGYKTKEVADTKPDRVWTDDEIFGGRPRHL